MRRVFSIAGIRRHMKRYREVTPMPNFTGFLAYLENTGKRERSPFAPHEDDYIRENWMKVPPSEMSLALCRPQSSIYYRARILGIPKRPRRGPHMFKKVSGGTAQTLGDKLLLIATAPPGFN